MRKTVFNASIILLLQIGTVNFSVASMKPSSQHQEIRSNGGSCITLAINNNESIIHIVIMGTSQGEGKLEFKNAKNEIVYSQTIKTWNERTDLDIEQTAFLAGDYTVSFTSVSMKCDAEFSFK